MRIVQGRVSNSLSKFKAEYLKKFDLLDCLDVGYPIVFFGMYDASDYDALARYRNKIIVVWCGTDSMMISPAKANILRKSKATHIVKSRFMSADLRKLGIAHKILPVSWQSYNIEPVALGDHIFHYGTGDSYGERYLDGIEKGTGLRIIRTVKDTYSKEELMKIYRSCFINLRLTKHDGLPNTVLEMGMMGRRSIYNGGIPPSIGWSSLEGIIQSINKEYENRENINVKEVSDTIKKFINIGNNWLKL